MPFKVHLLYDPGYVIARVSNHTKEKSGGSMCEFPNGVRIPLSLLKTECSNVLIVT
jgi:hypothetical protein